MAETLQSRLAVIKTKLEPLVGFEPTTCSLRMSCSTPELQRLMSIFSIICPYDAATSNLELLAENSGDGWIMTPLLSGNEKGPPRHN